MKLNCSLATITNADSNNYAFKETLRLLTNSNDCGYGVWTGMQVNYTGNHDSYRWIDGVTDVVYSNWKTEEPQNSHNDTLRCGKFSINYNTSDWDVNATISSQGVLMRVTWSIILFVIVSTKL